MIDETWLACAVAIRPLSHDVREIIFEMIDPSVLTFRAGQAISMKGGSFYDQRLKRTYSIASPPSQGALFALSVRLVGGYKGTEFMSRIKVGDTVSFMPPFGEFVIDPASTRPVNFVATGTGTSPCRAMILDQVEQGGGRPMTFYYGAAIEADVIYEEEFRSLEKACPYFRYVPTLVRPGSCWSGRRGLLADIFRHDHALQTDADWYLAGNGAMIDEVQEILRSRGVPGDRVRIEKFFPAR